MIRKNLLFNLGVCIASAFSVAACNGASGTSSVTPSSNVFTSSCLSAYADYVSQSDIPSIIINNNCDVNEKLSDVTFKLLSNSSIAKNAKFTANNGDVLDFSKDSTGSLATINTANIDSIPAGASIIFEGVKSSTNKSVEKLTKSIIDEDDLIAVIKISDLDKLPSSGGVFITDLPQKAVPYNSTLRDIPPGQFGLKAIKVMNKYSYNVTIQLNQDLPKGISYSYAYARPTDPTRTTCVGAGAVLKPNQSCNVVFKFEPTKQGINSDLNYSVKAKSVRSAKLLPSMNILTVNYSSRTYLYFSEQSGNNTDVLACKILPGGSVNISQCKTQLQTSNGGPYVVTSQSSNGTLYAISTNPISAGDSLVSDCTVNHDNGILTCNTNTYSGTQGGVTDITVHDGMAYITAGLSASTTTNTPFDAQDIYKCGINADNSINIASCVSILNINNYNGIFFTGLVGFKGDLLYLTPLSSVNSIVCSDSKSLSASTCASNLLFGSSANQGGYPNSVSFYKENVYFTSYNYYSNGLQKCAFDAKHLIVANSCSQVSIPGVPGAGTSIIPQYSYIYGSHLYVGLGSGNTFPVTYMCNLDRSGNINGNCTSVTPANNSGMQFSYPPFSAIAD